MVKCWFVLTVTPVDVCKVCSPFTHWINASNLLSAPLGERRRHEASPTSLLSVGSVFRDQSPVQWWHMSSTEYLKCVNECIFCVKCSLRNVMRSCACFAPDASNCYQIHVHKSCSQFAERGLSFTKSFFLFSFIWLWFPILKRSGKKLLFMSVWTAGKWRSAASNEFNHKSATDVREFKKCLDTWVTKEQHALFIDTVLFSFS